MSKELFFAINVLGSIPNINKGGCGIAALSIYRYLLKHKQRCKIVYFYHDSDRYTDNLKGKPNSCSHAVIYYKGEYYDAHGIEVMSKIRCQYRNQMPINLVIKSINNANEWNPEFYRQKYIPIIEKKLGIDLSDICFID